MLAALLFMGRMAELTQALREKAGGAPVSWVAGENVHLTLRFLGEVDDRTYRRLNSSVVHEAIDLTPEIERALGVLEHLFRIAHVGDDGFKKAGT